MSVILDYIYIREMVYKDRKKYIPVEGIYRCEEKLIDFRPQGGDITYVLSVGSLIRIKYLTNGSPFSPCTIEMLDSVDDETGTEKKIDIYHIPSLHLRTIGYLLENFFRKLEDHEEKAHIFGLLT